MDISLEYPFPRDKLSLLWGWIHEFPQANLDDTGPKDYVAFENIMLDRIEKEVTCGVIFRDNLVGIIGYKPTTESTGLFHGICFAHAVHGRGVASKAVRTFIAKLFAEGVEKIWAEYFASNRRIRRFFISLGAKDEGYIREATIQNGLPLDMYRVVFVKE